LQGARELNGKQGRIASYAEDTARFIVELAGDVSTKAVKPANLRKLPPKEQQAEQERANFKKLQEQAEQARRRSEGEKSQRHGPGGMPEMAAEREWRKNAEEAAEKERKKKQEEQQQAAEKERRRKQGEQQQLAEKEKRRKQEEHQQAAEKERRKKKEEQQQAAEKERRKKQEDQQQAAEREKRLKLEEQEDRRKRQQIEQEAKRREEEHAARQKKTEASQQQEGNRRVMEEQVRSAKVEESRREDEQPPLSMLEALVVGLRGIGEATWEDPDFPPAPASLCHDWSSVRHTDKWGTLVWKRSSDLSSWMAPALAPMPEGGVSAADIQQGMLGDCYFLAALSALADRSSSLAEDLIATNAGGTRAGVSVCRLSISGRWRSVAVSHTFPCVSWGKLAFSSAARGSLWVPLLEKAWAKLHGSYQAIESGLPSEAFRALTGAPVRYYRLSEARRKRANLSSMTPSGVLRGDAYVPGTGAISRDAAGDTTEEIWSALMEAVVSGFPVCGSCGSQDGEERFDSTTGLVHGHSYTVLCARIADGKRFALLRNPWGAGRGGNDLGSGRWHGAFARGGAQWTARLAKQLAHPALDEDGGSGVFWMPYSDFLQHFSSLDVCRILPGHESGCIDVHFPQGLQPGLAAVQLKPSASGRSWISLLQPSRRGTTKTKSSSEGGTDEDDCDPVGLEVLVISGGACSLVASSPFHPRREVSLDVVLEAGAKYLVLVHVAPRRSAAAAETGANRVVTTYSPGPVQLKAFAGDVGQCRHAAYEAATMKNGKIIHDEEGAMVRSWSSEHGYATVLLFSAGSNLFLASVKWTLRNLLLQPFFPQAPDPEDVASAATRRDFSKRQIVELRPHGQQMSVLSWVDSRSSYSVRYEWMASSRPCMVCSYPVGCPVEGRFKGEFFQYDLDILGCGRKYVHAECQDLSRVLLGGSCRRLRPDR